MPKLKVKSQTINEEIIESIRDEMRENEILKAEFKHSSDLDEFSELEIKKIDGELKTVPFVRKIVNNVRVLYGHMSSSQLKRTGVIKQDKEKQERV